MVGFRHFLLMFSLLTTVVPKRAFSSTDKSLSRYHIRSSRINSKAGSMISLWRGLSRKTAASYGKFRSSLKASQFGRSIARGNIILVSNPAVPFVFGGRSYYWADRYYRMRANPTADAVKCTAYPNSSKELEDIVLSPNRTKPDVLVWECRLPDECCGMECCSAAETGRWRTLLLLSIASSVTVIAFLFICVYGLWRDRKEYAALQIAAIL
ncbi:hypothetical protein AB6A40_009530 [Gnathostoma spinigerum]|uniref:CX domain-containing protein n=1 Tax=Gnathostoma spinigerum TaxID=75299 RepID=A0ABD6ESJ2_9BILA